MIYDIKVTICPVRIRKSATSCLHVSSSFLIRRVDGLQGQKLVLGREVNHESECHKKTSKMVIVLNKIKTYFLKATKYHSASVWYRNLLLPQWHRSWQSSKIPSRSIRAPSMRILPERQPVIPLSIMWICSPVNWRERICGHRC